MTFLDDAGLVQLWQNITARLSNKMDVTPGKVLSSNDFTDEYKEKLDSLEKLSQADWEASEGEGGYVKNRTHWVDKEIGEIVPETSLTFVSYNGFPACFSPEPYAAYPSVNTTYKVIWRGQEYECTSHEGTVNGITVVALGNSAPVFAAFGSSDGMNTEDPFALCFMPESAVSAFNAYVVTVSFDGHEDAPLHIFGEKLNYHKLDKNYLPVMNDFLVNGNNYGAIRNISSPDNEYKMGDSSIAFGYQNKTYGGESTAFGYKTTALGHYASSMGLYTLAFGNSSTAAGNTTTAFGDGSHTEGWGDSYSVQVIPTSNNKEYIIKCNNCVIPLSEILKNQKEALLVVLYKRANLWTYTYASCEKIIEEYSFDNIKIQIDQPLDFQPDAEVQEEYSGWLILNGYAHGSYSHVEGINNITRGYVSHAEGQHTLALGQASHTEGVGTYAEKEYQHVQGKYNATSEKVNYAHIVGNGTSDNNRSNAYALDWNGNAYFAGDVYVNGDGKDDFAGMEKLATTFDLSDYANKNATERVLTDLYTSSKNRLVSTINGKTGCAELKWKDLGERKGTYTYYSWAPEDTIGLEKDLPYPVGTGILFKVVLATKQLPSMEEVAYSVTLKIQEDEQEQIIEYTDGLTIQSDETSGAALIKINYIPIAIVIPNDNTEATFDEMGSFFFDDAGVYLFKIDSNFISYQTQKIVYGDAEINWPENTIDPIPEKYLPESVVTNDKLHSVATSGNYNDLINRPDVATQNDIANLASTTYVDNKIAALVDSSPETLNTLNELAAALGDDPNFATTIATQIGELEENKVEKIAGKGLSTNDYTTADKTLLNTIADQYLTRDDIADLDSKIEAAHSHAVTYKGSAFANGLYKITTNAEGHVTGATAVAKADITALGIPAQDTTYSAMTNDEIDAICGATIISPTDNFIDETTGIPYRLYVNNGKLIMEQSTILDYSIPDNTALS